MEAAVAAWRAAVAVVCAAVAQRRGGARWQRWRDSGAVIEALNGPLPTAGATVAAGGGDAAGAATAVGASSGDDGRRGGGASTAASRRSTEEVDRALAAEIKARKESDTRMTALLAERSAAVE